MHSFVLFFPFLLKSGTQVGSQLTHICRYPPVLVFLVLGLEVGIIIRVSQVCDSIKICLLW